MGWPTSLTRRSSPRGRGRPESAARAPADTLRRARIGVFEQPRRGREVTVGQALGPFVSRLPPPVAPGNVLVKQGAGRHPEQSGRCSWPKANAHEGCLAGRCERAGVGASHPQLGAVPHQIDAGIRQDRGGAPRRVDRSTRRQPDRPARRELDARCREPCGALRPFSSRCSARAAPSLAGVLDLPSVADDRGASCSRFGSPQGKQLDGLHLPAHR